MKKRKRLNRLLSTVMSFVFCFGFIQNISTKVLAQETGTTILSSDFEDGTTQGWTGNGATIAASSDVAHNGLKSLKVSGRTDFWQNPTYDILSKVKSGDVITFSVWVYYKSSVATKPFNLTANYISNGKEDWKQLEGSNNVTVSSDTWTNLKGTITVPADVTKFNLYAEIPTENASGSTKLTPESFYIDDAVITDISATPPSPTQSGISTNFEDNTAEGWYTDGSAGSSVKAVSGQGHTGTYGLLTTDRQTFSDVPKIELKDDLTKGKTYTYTAWVKFDGASSDSRLVNITTCKKDTSNPDGLYTQPTDAYLVPVKANTWTKVQGTLPFDYTGTLSSYIMYVEIANENPYIAAAYNKDTPIVDFYIDDVTVQENTKPAQMPIQTDIPNLKDSLNFPIGAAVEPAQIEDPLHAQLLAKHFNSIVGENCMKFDATEPTEGNFTFDAADKLVDFAIANNMKVRGHNLLWYQALPDWIFKHKDGTPLVAGNAADKQLLLDRLKNHITTTIQHFNNKYGAKNPIYCWDVVNEPIAEDGSMRIDPWYQIIGPDYVEKAFEFAREADPNVKLYLNEYNQENPSKGDGIFNLAKSLKDKNLIDGVGYQAHIDINSPSVESMKAVIDRYAAIGLMVQITELDVSTIGAADENTLLFQGYRYKALFDMFKQEAAAGKLNGVTFWGLADDHTWLTTSTTNNAPLLFDDMLQAKPAYWGIVNPSHLPIYIQNASTPQGSPKLGASLDNIWYTAKPLSVSNFVKGSGTPSTIKAMWDSKYLYVLADVKDSTIHQNDGIEIFVDRNNSKSKSYESDDSHYTIQYNGSTKDGIKTVSKLTSDGYMLQAQIPIDSIAPAQGGNIGFDVRINDDAGNSTIDNVSVWNDTSNSMNTSTANFGTLTFDKAAKITEAIKGTPTIDGQNDSIWQNANEISTDVAVNGIALGTAKAKVKTLWDDNYIYVLANVTDSTLDKSSANAYEQDSIETFVDENNAKTVNFQTDDAQYRVNFDNETSFGGGCNPTLFKSATSKTDTGYIVEEAIPINTVKIEAGQILGFDVQVNDATGGKRTGVAMWCDASGNSYKNTNGFGNLRLVDSTVPTATASVKGGLFNASQNVTLTSSIPSDMYYTLDGSNPDAGSTLYTAPIEINKTATLKFIAISKSSISSSIYSETYTIDTIAPVITIKGVENGKSYNKPISVSFSTNEGTIVATLDGKAFVGESITAVGKHTLVVKATDTAGNISTKTVTFTINSTLNLPKTGYMIDTIVMVALGIGIMVLGGIFLLFGKKKKIFN